MLALGSSLIGSIAYDLFDSGLADVLGVETLRHGTNALNYLSIRVIGGNPSCGGQSTGSTNGWNTDDSIYNYFYLFKDRDFVCPCPNAPTLFKKVASYSPYTLSRYHCYLSGYNLAVRFIPDFTQTFLSKVRNVIGVIGGIVAIAITPTLRFRFARIDNTIFLEDFAYRGAAYKTARQVGPWRIGMIGTLFAGLNLDCFSRIKKNPQIALRGIAKLASAALITFIALNILITQPYMALAGALLV